jgi:four helix bundle protein
MGMTHVSVTKKPYDIRERSFVFACAIVAGFPSKGWIDHASLQCWSQLVDSATSAGAQLQEAGAGGTRKQFLALNRGALREMRESHFWIRVIVATKCIGHEIARQQLDEADELTSILTTIVKNTIANMKKPKGSS